jgi:spore germination cell wall hydrolase CwlJ-like protein
VAIAVSLSLAFPAITDANGNSWIQSVYNALGAFVGDRTPGSPIRIKQVNNWHPPARSEGKAQKAVWVVSDDLSEQIECLALNIYWEAKSEPMLGQVAVAAVTLNRVMDPAFPKTVCDVVRQGGKKRLHKCHFSWWCDGRTDEPREEAAWRQALSLASAALLSGLPDPTRGALWYHADYVRPWWAREMRQATRIGRHIFYHGPVDRDRAVSEGL